MACSIPSEQLIMTIIRSSPFFALLFAIAVSALLSLISCQTPALGVGVPIEELPPQLGVEIPDHPPQQGVEIPGLPVVEGESL